MDERYVLAIDQGTTSTRALLFDHTGRVAGCAQRELTQHFPQPGWVEHDASEILASVLTTIAEVLTVTRTPVQAIAALGITNQRETVVIWEKATGRPIHRAIVWQSRQSEGICAQLRAQGAEPLIRERTGLLIDPYFSGTKLRWLLDQLPGARARAGRGELLAGTIDSWLVWNLSGGRRHVTDASNASRTLLYDIHARRWDDELLALLDVPRALLPEVCASSGVLGTTDPRLTLGVALPIAGLAGDQQAALFGQGCHAPGMAKNTYGTGCFLLMHTGAQAVRSRHGLLTTIAWQIGDQLEYALEGSIFVAGSAVQWLRDGLKLIDIAADSEALAQSVASTGGVYCVPAFVGLGAPYWRSDVRGALFGLTRGSGRAEICRAVLEAIAFQTRDVLDAMQADAGLVLERLRVDGGAVANAFLMQFQSDILGVPVERPAQPEATAFGAAALAGLATGFWSDRAAIAACCRPDRRFEPALPAAGREASYAGWRQAVQATLGFRIDPA